MGKKDKYNDKHPLILFSGGLDSTYLLQQELEKGHVYTLYVTGALNSLKMRAEKEAREKIKQKLLKGSKHYILGDYEIDVGKLFAGIPDLSFSQPAMWLTGALQVTDPHYHSELMIGYVHGDGINQHLQDIAKAWKSMQSFTKAHPIPINFPLRYTTKQDILDKLQRDVVFDTWMCEGPIEVAGDDMSQATTDDDSLNPKSKLYDCGHCLPCLTIFGEIQKWQRKWDIESYQDHIQQIMTNVPLVPLPEFIKTKKDFPTE